VAAGKMPKKSGKKGKKGGKPEWMSEDMFALSQDPTRLVEGMRGTLDKTGPCGNISKEQVRSVLTI
jgi:hypothetical protein